MGLQLPSVVVEGYNHMSTLSVDTINGQTTASKVAIPNHIIQVQSVTMTDTQFLLELLLQMLQMVIIL